jgi:hypothetical protein
MKRKRSGDGPGKLGREHQTRTLPRVDEHVSKTKPVFLLVMSASSGITVSDDLTAHFSSVLNSNTTRFVKLVIKDGLLVSLASQ